MISENSANKAIERDIASHIFSTSTMMMGVCLAVISLINGRQQATHLTTVVDDIIAVDALLFLVSCMLSYTVLRSRHMRCMHRIETVADSVFLIGMTGMAIACVLFVWTLL